MKTLFTIEQFKNTTSQQTLPLQCLHCLSTFYLPKHEIQKVLASKTQYRTNNYCSKKCHNKSKIIPRKSFTCSQCTKPIERLEKRKKSKNIFCSQSCAATYNNLHKTKGTRCSKLERWLQSKLPSMYSQLKFEFNSKNAVNSELDIYIPTLKLAFELNGIYHYEPIHGLDKFQKIQSNDSKKFQLCLNSNIELCIIDTSTLLYFKELNAQKYLDIICSIIEQKLATTLPALPVSA